MIPRLPFRSLFAIASSGALAALVACGSLSDPSKDDTSTPIAKVSGALSGGAIVPEGTRVALVWRTAAGELALGADVPVVAGRFTMDLAAPPFAYLTKSDSNGSSS